MNGSDFLYTFLEPGSPCTFLIHVLQKMEIYVYCVGQNFSEPGWPWQVAYLCMNQSVLMLLITWTLHDFKTVGREFISVETEFL